MTRHDLYRAPTTSRCFRIDIEAGEAFTANSSDYHEFTIRLVRVGQSTGEKVGSTYSLSDRSLVANEPVTVYDDAVGLAMTDGEILALYIDETGSPTILERVVVWMDVQPAAR